jgi:drug/metabolite transporter superfamily protein YnfA
MIHLMMWANVVLFVLVILLALVHFLQAYRAAAAFVFGIVLFCALAWLIIKAATTPKEEEEH